MPRKITARIECSCICMCILFLIFSPSYESLLFPGAIRTNCKKNSVSCWIKPKNVPYLIWQYYFEYQWAREYQRQNVCTLSCWVEYSNVKLLQYFDSFGLAWKVNRANHCLTNCSCERKIPTNVIKQIKQNYRKLHQLMYSETSCLLQCWMNVIVIWKIDSNNRSMHFPHSKKWGQAHSMCALFRECQTALHGICKTVLS